MKSDPMDSVTVNPATPQPPWRGPGSGKDAWIAYARDQAENGVKLWVMIDEQSAVIRELQGEVELLRRQIAERKPKGGRPKTDDKTTARIEAALAGGMSQRKVAKLCGVSAMTVSRVAQRVAERGAVK